MQLLMSLTKERGVVDPSNYVGARRLITAVVAAQEQVFWRPLTDLLLGTTSKC